MSKTSSFRGPFDKQNCRRAQALLKSASQHLYVIHWSLSSQSSQKKSLLLTCKILGLLVNALAAECKYPVLIRDNLKIPIQMHLSQKRKTFSELFVAFLKSRLNFKCFEEKYDHHRFRTSDIMDSENVVRWMSKNSRFREPLAKHQGKRAQSLLNSALQHLYHIHWSLPRQYSWKKSLWLTCKILVLLVNTLIADEKYPVLNRDNLTILIRIELSQKQNSFYQFLFPIFKSILNFKYFERKDDPNRFCISETTDSENVVS